MKKIVFATIPMQSVKGNGWDSDGYIYKNKDNPNIEYNEKVKFAIDGFLAKTLKKGDNVKVIRILLKKPESEENANLQEKELEQIREKIGAHVEYDEVITEFNDSASTIEKRFQELINKLEENCEIVLDMTFGTKTLIPILFYVCGFAEKFFNANIKNIIYDKIEFMKLENGKSVPNPDTCEIFDVTSLYYLNSLTSVMSAPDGKTALERLKKFLAL